MFHATIVVDAFLEEKNGTSFVNSFSVSRIGFLQIDSPPYTKEKTHSARKWFKMELSVNSFIAMRSPAATILIRSGIASALINRETEMGVLW